MSVESPFPVHEEIEFTRLPELSPKEALLVDLHSLVNLLNVLQGTLELLREGLPELLPIHDEIAGLGQSLPTLAAQGQSPQFDLGLPGRLLKRVEEIFHRTPETPGLAAEDDRDLRESLLRSLEIFEVRLQEWASRQSPENHWQRFSAEDLEQSLYQVLTAIEKNAQGRYRIVHNIAEQSPKDYQVDFAVTVNGGESFLMPAVLQDVLRDLVANARKYTPPGGKITAGIHASPEGVRLVVEDNGVGIPTDELPRVVEFGYRASNTAHRPTLGGGFGLTKALWVTRNFSGRFWIRSRPSLGTRVTIFIPTPSPSPGEAEKHTKAS